MNFEQHNSSLHSLVAAMADPCKYGVDRDSNLPKRPCSRFFCSSIVICSRLVVILTTGWLATRRSGRDSITSASTPYSPTIGYFTLSSVNTLIAYTHVGVRPCMTTNTSSYRICVFSYTFSTVLDVLSFLRVFWRWSGNRWQSNHHS